MATVKLNEYRITEILARVLSKDTEELDQAHKKYQAKFAHRLYAVIVGDETYALLSQLPNLHKIECQEYVYAQFSPEDATPIVRYSYQLDPPMPKLIYPHYYESGALRKKDMSNTLWNELVAGFCDLQEQTKRLDEKRQKFRVLLTQCGTLQNAVKVWPSLLEFVSDKTREQYHKKPEKGGKKEPVTIPEDMILTIVQARMNKNAQ